MPFSSIRCAISNPDQLVLVTKNMPMFELQKSDASALDFLDYRDLSKSFSGMAALDLNSVNLTGDQEPIRVFGLRTSANLFPMLGVQPIAGRVFRGDEEHPGKNHVAILGLGFGKTGLPATRESSANRSSSIPRVSPLSAWLSRSYSFWSLPRSTFP